jgi:hypothetical protein
MREKSCIMSVLLLIIIITVDAQSKTISSAMLNDLHKRSLILLAKFNLNPINKTPFYNEQSLNFPLPLERSFQLDTSDSNPQKPGSYSKLFFQQLQDVSVRIGLNPSLYIGKRFIRLNYALHDSSQGNTAITAHILFSDTNLAGAYLAFERYYGGIVSLNDRSEFKPINFVFPRFNPDLLDTVSLCGPWDKSDNRCNWIYRVNFSKEEISYLVNTFSAGKKIKNELRWVKDSVEEYAVDIKVKTGERFFPHFIFRNDTVYLDDYKCYYILDRKFMYFVKEITKSRGISSTCKDSAAINYRNRIKSARPGLPTVKSAQE